MSQEETTQLIRAFSYFSHLANLAEDVVFAEASSCAAALAHHGGQHRLAGEEHAFQVEVDLRIPDLFAHLHRATLGRAAHVVHVAPGLEEGRLPRLDLPETVVDVVGADLRH